MVGTRASCQPIPVLRMSAPAASTLLRQRDDFLAGGAAFDQIDRGYPVDDDEIRPRRRPHLCDQFDRKAMAIFRGSAPPVTAIIGPHHGEFVDQVAFRAHDLDTVEPGLPGEHRAAHIVRNRLLYFRMRHRARRKAVDARTDIGRAEAFFLSRIASGMQYLQANLAVVPMHRVGDLLQFLRLRMFGQDRAARLDQPRGIGRVAAGDDQTDLAPGALGEKHRHFVQPVLLHVEAGVHRSHDHPVAQRGAAHLQRCEQMRIERRPRTGLHKHCPVMAGTADLKFLHHLPQTHPRNFRSKSGTRIMDLLSALSHPKFVKSMLQRITNFGCGALALRTF